MLIFSILNQNKQINNPNRKFRAKEFEFTVQMDRKWLEHVGIAMNSIDRTYFARFTKMVKDSSKNNPKIKLRSLKIMQNDLCCSKNLVSGRTLATKLRQDSRQFFDDIVPSFREWSWDFGQQCLGVLMVGCVHQSSEGSERIELQPNYCIVNLTSLHIEEKARERRKDEGEEKEGWHSCVWGSLNPYFGSQKLGLN